MPNSERKPVIETYGRDLKISVYKDIVKEEESNVNKPNWENITYWSREKQ